MRTWGASLAAFLLAIGFNSGANAGSMCNSDKTGTTALENATAKASAKFLGAANEAFLAFKAAEERSEDTSRLAGKSVSTLDEVIAGYNEALKLTGDLGRADVILKDRPLERLQEKLRPGTIAALRWQFFVKVARESKNPASDLIKVCSGGATRLQPMMKTVVPNIAPSDLRRIEEAWSTALSNGVAASDIFDQSVRP